MWNLHERSESWSGKQVRAQLAGEVAAGGKVSIVQIARNIVKTEGPLGLYSGLSAAAARQVFLEYLILRKYNFLCGTMCQNKT